MSAFDSYGYRPGEEPLPRDEPTEIGSPVYCWMKTGELAVSYTPHWVCPRCHIERAKALEDAARVAEELPLVGELAPGIADGLSSAAHQIATAIRALIKEPTP